MFSMNMLQAVTSHRCQPNFRGMVELPRGDVEEANERTPLILYDRRPSPTFTLHGTCLGCCSRSVSEQSSSCQSAASYEEIRTDVEEEDAKQGDFVMIFAFWNAMMGSSLLAMPWAFQEAGILQGFIVLFVVASLTMYTCYLIFTISKANANPVTGMMPEFADICTRMLGKFGTVTCALTSFVLLSGCLVVYWILMVQLLYNSIMSMHYLYSVGDKNIPPLTTSLDALNNTNDICMDAHVQSENQMKKIPGWSENRTVPLFLVAFFAPILQFRSMTFFNRFAAAGTSSVFFLLGYTFYKASTWGLQVNFADISDNHYIPLFSRNFPALSGIFGMGFFSHNSVITFFKRAKNPQNNGRNIGISYGLVVLTYAIIGMGIYLTYPHAKHCLKQNFFENISDGDVMSMVVQLVYFLRMMTLFPIISFVLRVQLFTGMYQTEYPGHLQVALLNVFIITSSVLSSMFFPQIGDIIRYLGSFCGMIYMFILPCVVYLMIGRTKRREEGKPLGALSVFVHTVIMIVGVLNFLAQFFVHG